MKLFVSYAREDAAVAERLARALEASGHEVWWDRQLRAGSAFSDEIEQALDTSEKVLVLWSAWGVRSPWVRDEAAVARDADKLLPLTLDKTLPPLGFRQFHAIDLGGWLNGSDASLPDSLALALGSSATGQPADRAEQRVAFCRTPDKVTLAYSKTGSGPPLVKSANWMNHLEHEWNSPMWRHWIDELSVEHTLLRYDERGNGMSDWDVPALTFDSFVDDLDAVADAAGFGAFDLVGVSQGSPVAIAYAVRFPERVKRMVLINGFAAGWRHSRDPEVIATWDALATLARTGWGKDNAAFRQTFTNLFFPDATPEQAHWWNELQRLSASPENAERLMRLFGDIDVSSLLGAVAAPTLVIHCRDDHLVPFEAGRLMAARIPGAEFLAVNSRNHLPLASEPAWPAIRDSIRRFLA